jgi:hypothetical protein
VELGGTGVSVGGAAVTVGKAEGVASGSAGDDGAGCPASGSGAGVAPQPTRSTSKSNKDTALQRCFTSSLPSPSMIAPLLGYAERR